MNTHRIVLGTIAASMTLAATVSCESKSTRRPPTTQTVSGATPMTKGKDVVLPPKVGDYEVLGVTEGLKNFVVKYDQKFYRGGEPVSDAAAESLKARGIKTIISITPNDHERTFCRKHGLTLVEIPFSKPTGPSPVDLARFYETVKTGSGPFYVHCHGGTHRGGVLGVAYRTGVLGWSKDKALIEFGRLGGDLLVDHSMLEAVLRARRSSSR